MSTAGQHPTARWATVWTTAFETAAADDPAALAAGRALAGTLGQLNVCAGVATSKIPAPGTEAKIRPLITVPVLDRRQWDEIYTAIAQDAQLAAVLRTERLSDALADPARTAGWPIVPGPADIVFTCTCRAAPGICPHSAAVAYGLADRARTAPAVLLALRGRAHKHLKAYLRAAATAPVDEDAGEAVCAEQAYHRWSRRSPDLPPPRSSDARHGTPVLDTCREEPPAPAPSLEILGVLVRDAAQRAAALLSGDHTPPAAAVLTDAVLTDAVRLLSTPGGEPYAQAAADRLSLAPGRLRHLIAAHTYGGADGVQVTVHRTPADPDTLARAEAAIQPIRPAQLSMLERDHNRITDPAARVQLRLGPDGRWYPFTDWLGTWRPAPGPDADPAAAYKAARLARATQPGGG